MNVCTFEKLLGLLTPYLIKRSRRPSLPPEFRLALTLRYLATGDQVASLAFAYRIGISTAHATIYETCIVLTRVLAPLHLQPPKAEKWKEISAGFLYQWNMPNCLGPVDGKHVVIQCPPNAGSEFFNYKKTFSIVLMAACDANYKFTLIDIGSSGSNNDSSIFNSGIRRVIDTETLQIPNYSNTLPGSNVTLPNFFIGDEAFQLSRTMMKPYPARDLNEKRKIFNYRLSRARRVIENSFGILASRWRVYRKPICCHPSNAEEIVKATLCLHNFLMNENENYQQQMYCPPTFVDHENDRGEMIDGEWRSIPNALQNSNHAGSHRATGDAYRQRDLLAEYFLTPQGEVPWQLDYIRRGINNI